MDDPGLVDRLYDSGAKFTSEIQTQTSPLLGILLTWILPIIIFMLIGRYMSKKMMDKSGGANSMMFGMGKSNAKIYVKSSDGIRFSDVAGEDEAKENLAEIVEYLHDPGKYREVGASNAQGGPACRTSGNRQDHACKGGSGRVGRAFLFHVRL